MARLRILALLVAVLLLPSTAEARRVALVIGNGAYETVPRLPNPVSDAEAVAAALRAGGFDVTLARDAGRAALEAALRAFARDAVGAEIALFFFAGHGLQIGGENYVVPTDARLAAASDVDFELVPLDLVARALSGAQARILILDACRDNPMAARLPAGSRSAGRGLAPVERVDLGMLIAFSTAPGAVALDGTSDNSPFTEALVEHLRTPGLEIRQVMTRVRRSVVERTGGRQVPWDNSSLLADIVLTPPAPEPPVAAAPPPAAPPAPPMLTRAEPQPTPAAPPAAASPTPAPAAPAERPEPPPAAAPTAPLAPAADTPAQPPAPLAQPPAVSPQPPAPATAPPAPPQQVAALPATPPPGMARTTPPLPPDPPARPEAQAPGQRVASLPPPPPPMPRPPAAAALPRAEAPPARDGLAGRIAFAANARSIPLPADLPRPVPGAAGLNGAFVTGPGRNPLGRQVLVVLAPEAGGAVDVLFGAGPGWRLGFSEGLPAFAIRRTLRPGWGGALSFEDATGDQYRISLGWSGQVVVAITRPTLQGWREGIGRNSREAANPTAQAALNRLEPP